MADVFDYTDCFYNPRHSTVGYLSAVEFEMQAGLPWQVSTEPCAGHIATSRESKGEQQFSLTSSRHRELALGT